MKAMQPYRGEFARYHKILHGTLRQLDRDAIFEAPAGGGNSIAVILKHLGGNLKSRFTNFLTEDGEKPWRNRDGEFLVTDESFDDLLSAFEDGYGVLMDATESLGDGDRTRTVVIRGNELNVAEALARSLAHFSYHVGEVVAQARGRLGERWKSLSIPPGQSAKYNANPDKERAPG